MTDNNIVSKVRKPRTSKYDLTDAEKVTAFNQLREHARTCKSCSWKWSEIIQHKAFVEQKTTQNKENSEK